MKKALPALASTLLLLLGIGVLLYPSFSDWLFRRNSSVAIQRYTQEVEELPAYDRAEQLRLAREYNSALTGNEIRDPFVPGSGVVLPDNYTSVMNIGGLMGYLDIPKLDVRLPVRHGTGESTLQHSVGHIEATAFPIGGEGGHCALTAHRGLAEARLFTDLDLLEAGDVFLIHVLGDTLCYQVNQVFIVEPEDVDELRPVEGKDYVTLITCHPYAINSHRLLVRGERIPYTMEEMPEEFLEKMVQTINWRNYIYICFAVLWVAFLAIYAIANKRNKKRSIKTRTRRW